MADDFKEDLALFSRPQTTYMGETGRPRYDSGEDSDSDSDVRPGAYQAKPRPPINTRDSQSANHVDETPAQDQTQGQHRTHPDASPADDDLHQGYRQSQMESQGQGRRPVPEEPYSVPPFDAMLAEVHDKAMTEAGFGRMQWVLLVVLGLGLMGDGIELLMIAYILPGAEKDLCMDEQMKGWLGAIAFAGMMAGAVVWGSLADRLGRRPTLLTSLIFNAVFAIAGAFVPTFWMFVGCRLLSGVGIGGSIPVVMSYFGEFCPRAGRGWRLGILLLFWVLGGVYVSALGWLIIPNKELFDVNLMWDTAFHSWRVFILVCLIPVVLSIFGLFAMPESPRYLLQVGRDLDALAVYRQIYKWNHTEPGAEYEMPEIELPNSGEVRNIQNEKEKESCCSGVVSVVDNFWNSIFQLFFTPLTTTTLVLCITWFCTSFGYYGLSIWFPEYIKKLEQEAYFARTQIVVEEYADTEFTGLLDNTKYFNSTFTNVSFRDIELRHVTFEMSNLTGCTFLNATSSKTYFVDSTIDDSIFNDTNFYPYKFLDTNVSNSSGVEFFGTRDGCQVDFDVSYSSKTVFLENFLCQLAVVPGALLSAALMDRVGRVRLLVGCLLVSAVSVFFIWFTDTEVAVVCINGVFMLVIMGAFNSIDVASMELYPTHLRATAFGFLSCLGRIAAILGNVTFGNFIAISKAVPILLTAAILAFGGLASLKLPESKDRLL